MTNQIEHFNEIYSKLNHNQQIAVDCIEGPVLVLAGPGTGKTQILSARIANILLKTDCAANNILCLTYTDAGRIAMRKRLIKMIGSEASKVHIHTFHSFCKSVIDENKELFKLSAEWQPVDEIEEFEIINKIIQDLPSNHILKDFTDQKTYDVGALKSFFGEIKKEAIDIEALILGCDNFVKDLEKIYATTSIEQIPELESIAIELGLVYKRKSGNNKAGDIKKKDTETLLPRYKKTLAAAQLFHLYQNQLTAIKRYDFHDMINWVIDAFASNENLLQDYKENLLYFLVDEFQDTNGAQIRILELLTKDENIDEPNIFVVGDDDQSIYSFQGAQYNRIQHFIINFNISSDKVVVLDKNYRSAQEILDVSAALIENNQQNRVVADQSLKKYIGEGLTKKLKAEGEYAQLQNAVQLQEYDTTLHQAAGVVHEILKISELQKTTGKGSLSDIAIIVHNHSNAEPLAKALQFQNIPFFYSKEVDILKEPLIEKVLDFLTFFRNVTVHPHLAGNTDLLFKIMHFDFLNIYWLDIQKFSIAFKEYQYGNNKAGQREAVLDWIDFLQNKHFLEAAKIENTAPIIALGGVIQKLFKALYNKTLQSFFEDLLAETGIMSYILNHEEKIFLIETVTVLFDFIKNITTNWDSNTVLASLNQAITQLDFVLNRISKMEKYGLRLRHKRLIGTEQGVHFLTAHGSKGLEYDYVFIFDVDKNKWEGKKPQNRSYVFPSNDYLQLPQFEEVDSQTKEQEKEARIEEDRRLFFVAITRAKKQVFITYSAREESDSNAEKSKYEPSAFVFEILNYLDELKADKKMPAPQFNRITVTNEEQVKLLNHLQILLAPDQPLAFEMVIQQYIDKRLQNYKLSVTDLGKYLKCPTTFYYEKILQVPAARSMSMGFGNVIHNSLEAFFKRAKDTGKFGTAQDLVDLAYSFIKLYHSHFTEKELSLKKEQIDRLLPLYHAHYIQDWEAHPNFDTEYKFQNVTWNEIPLSGVIDKIIHYTDNQIAIVDYKTGNPKNAKEKLKRPATLSPGQEVTETRPEKRFEILYGGDYWRQMAFYKMLIKNNQHNKNWRLKPNDTFDENEITKFNIYFDLIEGERKADDTLVFERVGMDITDYDVELVENQVVEVYSKIKNKEFNVGCGNCDWCKMVKNNFQPFTKVSAEMED